MEKNYKRLKKSLGLFDVFAFGIGPMLSSGLFLLPGMVFNKVGPASILAYFLAGVLVIPPLLSKAELSTAMPRAGGTYYFLDRSMGPLIGSIAGLGTWLSLTFKSAFDLIGLGAYLVFFLELPVKPVAMALCVLFAGLSISGVKNVGRFQGMFVSVLIAILAYFIGTGLFHTEARQFQPFFSGGLDSSFIGAIGFVFVTFTGITKIASVAEEVDNLERNIPLGMFLALGVTVLLYVSAMVVMVGVLPGGDLAASLTPVVDAATQFMGPVGEIVMASAAILAFVASANVGITAASRYPLAMSRDNLIPDWWKKIGKYHTPTRSIILTMGLMIFFILVMSPEGIAKLASALKLLIFGMINLAVIVMRESKIAAYDPAYKSFWYPWMQIIGIFTPLILIPELGLLPMIVSTGVVVVGLLWYFLYAEKRVQRSAAMYQMFQRMGNSASADIHRELRQLMREKGLRKEDKFEEIIVRAGILWHKEEEDLNDILRRASREMAKEANIKAPDVYKTLLGEIKSGITPLGRNIAIPHARMDGVQNPELVIVHSKSGINIEEEEPIHALFILISPKSDPQQHLRFLSELANRAENIDFSDTWRALERDRQIRNSFLRTGKVSEVDVRAELDGTTLEEIRMHHDCIIAVINRGNEMIVPHDDTVLRQGDTITLIGTEDAVDQMVKMFEKGKKKMEKE